MSAVIDYQPLVEALLPYVATALGMIITAAATVAVAKFNALAKKHNLSIDLQIDAAHRDALNRAATNLAGKLITEGAAKAGLDGKVTVNQQSLAGAVNDLIKRVPGAIDHFGIPPSKVGELIVEKLGLSSTENVPPTPVAFAGR